MRASSGTWPRLSNNQIAERSCKAGIFPELHSVSPHTTRNACHDAVSWCERRCAAPAPRGHMAKPAANASIGLFLYCPWLPSFLSSEPFPIGHSSFPYENACYIVCIGLRLPRDGRVGVFCQYLNCAKSSYNSFLADLFCFSGELSPSCFRPLVKADAKRTRLERRNESSLLRRSSRQSDILHSFGVSFYSRCSHSYNFAAPGSSECFPFVRPYMYSQLCHNFTLAMAFGIPGFITALS